MASKPSDVEVIAPVKPVGSFDLSLDEFCRRLSAKKISPEMIGGFHHVQLKRGLVKTSDAVFQAAFDQFCTQPA